MHRGPEKIFNFYVKRLKRIIALFNPILSFLGISPKGIIKVCQNLSVYIFTTELFTIELINIQTCPLIGKCLKNYSTYIYSAIVRETCLRIFSAVVNRNDFKAKEIVCKAMCIQNKLC